MTLSSPGHPQEAAAWGQPQAALQVVFETFAVSSARLVPTSISVKS